VTQELNFAQLELTLAKLRIELMITQSLKHTAELLFKFLLTFRKDQDIVNEDHGRLVQFFHENRIHQVHEVSGALVKPKDITRYS
jgi:hypothetical protein